MAVFIASAAVVAAVPLFVWSIAGGGQRTRKVSTKLDPDEALTDLRQLVLQRSARERVMRPGA